MMGCDIHLYVEKRSDNSVWEIVPPLGARTEYSDDYSWDCDRNYSLFTILAGVRNGYGFAGCDTGNPVTPIDIPRGLPDNTSDFLTACYESWGCDAHSASNFTVAELLSFDWTQNKTHRGYVAWDAWKEWKRCPWIRSPKSYCGGVSGPNVVILSQKEARDAVSCNRAFHPTESVYVNDEWVTPYWYCCKQFWSEIIPQLLAIGDPKHVRIVFWFDN